MIGTADASRPRKPYGFALKLLCDLWGERLPDYDWIGSIDTLQLDSPLAAPRLPIDIPAHEDFL